MKKKLLIAAVLLLVPVAALAGMSAISDSEMDDVQGRTGLTLKIQGLNVTADSAAWGDTDGFGAFTTDGWVILSGVDLPTIEFGGLFDVGTNGGVSRLMWTVGTTPLMHGDLTVGSVIIGSTATAATQSIGEIQARGLEVNFWDGVSGTINVQGH